MNMYTDVDTDGNFILHVLIYRIKE